MTLHAFIEWVKYAAKAKGRHGTHSPFVFSFAEWLKNNSQLPLTEKIHAYFKEYTVITVSQPGDWYTCVPHGKTIYLLEDIHKTAKHTASWDAIRESPDIKMSIDLYKCGMLLSLEEFKEKQHFILQHFG